MDISCYWGVLSLSLSLSLSVCEGNLSECEEDFLEYVLALGELVMYFAYLW